MNAMREWGYDRFRVEASLDQVIAASKHYDLRLFDLYLDQQAVVFYTPVTDRRKIKQAFARYHHEKTTGVIGFVLGQLHKPRRITAIIVSLLVLFLASNSVFAIEIRGSSQLLERRIEEYLKSQHMTAPRRKLALDDFQQFEQQLKTEFFADIEWINLSQIGSSYFIDYVPRIKKYPLPKYSDPLIAYQDGVIARFDVKRGVKKVKEHDFVRVGEVLVSPDVEATDSNVYQTYVEGKVYAYTQHELVLEMKPNAWTKLHPGFGFFQLLFESRRQITFQLQADERIEKENILLFRPETGRIRMKIHYTLYEDITHP